MAASTNLTPEQRTQRGRLAALARWSKEDLTTDDPLAQAPSLDEERREIIAEQGEIPEPELTRRADARRRCYAARAAYEASKVAQ